ncbi:MAG: DUF3570 domain-containing protein [Deltaproteobacteria bacterium]|nr:DUF3570 domain-containing protein [Deltaproteobacteria bacterium]
MFRLVLVLLVVASATPVLAGERAGGRVDVYADGDIVVVAPSAQLKVDASDAVQLNVGWMANVLSGATPLLTADAVSSATTFEDVRHAFDVGVSGRLDALTLLRGSARFSLESDYAVVTASVGLERESQNRRAIFTASYATLLDEAWTSLREGTRQTSVTHRLDGGLSLLLTKTTRLRLGVSGLMHACEELIGCQSNTYRYVAVRTLDSGDIALRETHPDRRARLATTLRLSQALGRYVALHGGYRFYADNWAVLAHTADLAVHAGLAGERVLLRAEGRMTRQTTASFFQPSYTEEEEGLPRYRSADRELAGLWSWRVGGRVEWAALGLGPLLRASWNLRAYHTWYRYPTLDPSLKRNAWVLGGGFDAEW